MFIGMNKRPYRQKQRAVQQEATRRQIVEAAMALHEELGPRDTTIAAIAARAGVQRLTVYRHFPDSAAIFRACSAHWLSLHPPPDPLAWRRLARPRAKARRALQSIYAYYRDTAAMWARVYRDREDVAALEAPVAEFEEYLGGIRDELAQAWHKGDARNRLLDAALDLAVRFHTWETLERRGLGDAAMAELMVTGCAAVARAGREP